jgi:hypothetical protein
MLFLWAFGIVVEGKLGVVKYLILYLAIGTLHGAFVQILLMRSGMDSHAAGASAIIYGLLATCMIWAPRNELNCTIILIIGFRVLVYNWDLYYTTVALLYIGEQVFGFVFWGAVGGRIMISELGHLSGAFWGTVVAVATLKANLVDCEGWDVFTLWAKWRKLGRDWKKRIRQLDHQKESLRTSLKANRRARRSKDDGAASADESVDGAGPSAQERAAAALRHIEWLLEKGKVSAALQAYGKSAGAMAGWPSQPELYSLIKAFHAKGAEVDSIRLMRDHCRNYPAQSTKMRLKLAQVLIRDCQRPTAAQRVLDEFGPDALGGDFEAARQRLVRQANQMVEEGVLELEGDD